MAPHSNILAWEIPWTEEPCKLQSMGSLKSQTWLRDNNSNKVKSLSCVWLFATPWTVANQVHGFFQARIREWFAISFSRGSSPPRDGTWVSLIADRHFTIWATGNRLAMLWPFQADRKGTQPHIHKYPFSPRVPSHPGCYSSLSRAPVLYIGPRWLPILNTAMCTCRSQMSSWLWGSFPKFCPFITCVTSNMAYLFLLQSPHLQNGLSGSHSQDDRQNAWEHRAWLSLARVNSQDHHEGDP